MSTFTLINDSFKKTIIYQTIFTDFCISSAIYTSLAETRTLCESLARNCVRQQQQQQQRGSLSEIRSSLILVRTYTSLITQGITVVIL